MVDHLESAVVENKQLSDRQFEALLERLDKLTAEVAAINRRLETGDGMLRITAQLATLNDSLQALAYAAIGRQGPDVRRRRTG
jgi:DNA-binding FrmR family transcriptional regulator